MRCVSPHVSPQVVEKFCPLVWEMGKRTWACAGVACPALPARLAADVSGGVACLLCRLPTMPLACLFAPYPPSPLPRWGRGRPRLFHARGFAPCIPGAEPMVCRKTDRISLPRAVPAAKERGDRGRGTIRRKRRRRLRWSSPPGQVEQMPHGERSPAPRRAAPEQGRIARWRRGLPPRFSFHALTGAAGCDILVYRTEPPRRTARKQKETPYRTAIPKRRKGENRA